MSSASHVVKRCGLLESRLRPTDYQMTSVSKAATRLNRIPLNYVGSLSICPLLFTRDLSGSVGLTGCAPSACRRGFACFLLLIHTTSDRSGGKVGIPPLLRDFQGAVGAVKNRFLVFHGFHGPAFSTALRRFY